MRITFRRFRTQSPRGMRGRSDLSLELTVNGTRVGNAADTWELRTTDRQNLDAAVYQTVIDVEGRTDPIEVVAILRMAEPADTRQLARVEHRVPWPFYPREHDDAVRGFRIEWTMEFVAPPPPPPPVGGGLFACREDHGGSATCATATATTAMVRIEAHEVIPTPNTGRTAPSRPTFPRGTPAEVTDGRAMTVAQMSDPNPLNVVENPSVVPILPAATTADATNCARFKITYYRPGTLNFVDRDPRLTWTIVSTGGGRARFFGDHHGPKVALHGITQGEIGLEIRFEGVLVANYRAMVLPLISIPSRVTIAYGSANVAQRWARPRSDVAAVQRHMSIANRFLWQLGLTLQLEADAAVGSLVHRATAANITPSGTDGIFNALIRHDATRNINQDTSIIALLNSKPWVANFVYIKSVFTPPGQSGTLGLASHNDAAREVWVRDRGTPSTSWISPSGIPPAAAATEQRMHLLGAATHRAHPNRFAMFVTDGNRNDFAFAGTIAHEFGHILGLMHRIPDPLGPWTNGDRLNRPVRENVMHFNETTDRAQDFDIIQSHAARICPLIVRLAAAAAAAPVPPPPAAPPAEPRGPRIGPQPRLESADSAEAEPEEVPTDAEEESDAPVS